MGMTTEDVRMWRELISYLSRDELRLLRDQDKAEGDTP